MSTVEISRREFLRWAGLACSAALTGCFPMQSRPAEKPTVAPAVPATKDQASEILSRTHQEVRRLVETYPQDSIVRKVYLGKLADISPVFADNLPVGVSDPRVTYARTVFGQAEYNAIHQFRYFLNRDQSLKDYFTLKKQAVAVYFSPNWLNSKNDAVKTLALEKEAYTLALWEPFSRIILNTYLAQGRIEKIDPAVGEAEIARTLARQILVENEDVRKLYDYAGYLPVLSRVGDLLATEDPILETELGYSNLPKIYKLAKQKSIELEGLQFGSKEFLQLAFDPEGPWAEMILDPSIPGPSLPLPS